MFTLIATTKEPSELNRAAIIQFYYLVLYYSSVVCMMCATFINISQHTQFVLTVIHRSRTFTHTHHFHLINTQTKRKYTKTKQNT